MLVCTFMVLKHFTNNVGKMFKVNFKNVKYHLKLFLNFLFLSTPDSM